MKHFFVLLLVFSVVFFIGCATMPKVERTAVDETIDLSGNWNDTDSRLVAQEMINDSVSRPWLGDFVQKTGKKPRVIVGAIVNKSHEHINTETFVNDLARELTNSGKVVFVAGRGEREEVREEKLDQAANASAETAKSAGQEYGADFMLKGSINTILDMAGKQQLKYYQVDLTLVDITSNEKVWLGQKKIKKLVKRPSVKF